MPCPSAFDSFGMPVRSMGIIAAGFYLFVRIAHLEGMFARIGFAVVFCPILTELASNGRAAA
jgi:hypothetical protein